MAGNLVFFGTPEFALPTLEALAAAGRLPARVVTQPARPVGRGRKLRQPPVAEWALERGLPLTQPRSVRRRELLELIASDRPEVAVVVAFGQIFPRALLELPRLGCINLHASLLPKYRGAAPVQAAIAAGERRTGVTTMRMEEGLDTGPILLQRSTEIGASETAGELGPRLAALGAELMVETLERLAAADIEPRPQSDGEATYAPRLTRADGRVDWTRSASTLFDRLRAFTPWPGLEARLREAPVKIVWGRPLPEDDPGGSARDAAPGEILGLRSDRRGEGLAVRAGAGSTFLLERLQRPGRPPRSARDFVNGERLEAGERFG